MENLKVLKNASVGDLLDSIYESKLDENRVISFKNKETEEIYNLAYHYVESEIMYLFVYKNSTQKTSGHLNCLINYESHDTCWNHRAQMYLEELAETKYSEDDYRFSSERIESGDLQEERLEVVKSLPVYVVFDDEKDIDKLDELLEDGSNIKEIKEIHLKGSSAIILF